MNPASDDIREMLEAESSLGLTFAVNLFVGKEPAHPDNCVTIFDTPGGPPSLTLEGKEGGIMHFPSVQIRVRDNSYLNGWGLGQEIHEILHGIHGEVWNGVLYSIIQSTGAPFLLDWDGKDRARFVCTYKIQRRPQNN